MGARIAVVAFDLYGTLLDIRGLAAQVAAAAPEDAGLLDRWRTAQLERTWELNRLGAYEPFDQVTAAALAQVAPQLEARQRALLCEAWLTLAPHADAAPALAQLEAAGIRCAVLSNGTVAMIRAAVAAARLPIDEIRSADEVRVYKPDPRVYALLDALAPREELLFVSANGWDAEGCKRAGRNVAFLERGGVPPQLAPDLRARSLGALADQLAPHQW